MTNYSYSVDSHNKICHYKKSGSDKIYILTIGENDNKFVVTSYWGSLKVNNLNKQVKGDYSNYILANGYANSFFNIKLKKGYIDIKDPSYEYGIKLEKYQRYLSNFSETPETIDEMLKPIKFAKNPFIKETFKVKCIDNIGLEEYFVINDIYEASLIKNESDMIEVLSENGIQECFLNRFIKI